ncbi:FCS-Like Zinc finger 8-like [Impatiens glandulifera]|uniref:FCS-Like Zinc finger 8-like n=1 Tax=Impatiens glandulifera TaxID=253017 RepID=UPI001FB12FEF|nr:FCS-Like Zinc finger 8-like [Impatiens glandulifera]
MAEYGSSPRETHRKLNSSSIFLSPRLFSGFTSKGISDSESLLSPTSILDTKSISAFRNPFWSDSKPIKPKPRSNWDKLEDSIGLGLAIVDTLKDDKSTPNFSKPDNRMVLFGSQLKIQIPPLYSPSVFQSPTDFGIKTRNTQLGPKSPSAATTRRSGSRSPPANLSASEMELSEDYTRVISYGPNPKTTHIFDDCIVETESCCGEVVGFPAAGKPVMMNMSCSSESFLSFCYSCKKSLGHGKDIYMYRGEKAFCSCECRFKEMMLEEEEVNDDEQKKKKVNLEVDDHLFW